MTTEMWIIALYRVIGSLPVLRWPFFGALLAMLVDNFDLVLMNVLELGGVRDYQEFDKWLDQVYMLAFLTVALGWAGVPRNIAVALYAFRMAGFAVFELSQEREVLILFPNVFEFWFVFVAGVQFFGWEAPAGRSKGPRKRKVEGIALRTRHPAPETQHSAHTWPFVGPVARFFIPYRYSRAQLAVTLTVLLVAKLTQEYVLHVGRWFDDFTMLEALEAIWGFFTPPY